MRAGKTQRMVEDAAVRQDALEAAGVPNPIAVVVAHGDAGEMRERLDAAGARSVQVIEMLVDPPWCECEEPMRDDGGSIIYPGYICERHAEMGYTL